MRVFFLAALGVGLLSGLLFVAGRAAIDALRDDGGDSAPAAPGTTPEPTPGTSPQATAEAFAQAWSKSNIEALYLLLDPASQRDYPLQLFEEVYTSFDAETTAISLNSTVEDVDAGRATLTNRLETAYFGVLEYSTTIGFTKHDGEWLVRWTPTSVHPDLTDGLRFRSDIELPRRGSILDRNGEPLAITAELRMLGLNRAIIDDREQVTTAVMQLGFTREQVDRAFDSPLGQNQRVPIGPVPDEYAETAINLLTIPGVLLYFESQRIHPLGPAAAHVVGYTRELTAEELKERADAGLKPGSRAGAIGIEASMDQVLAGQTAATLRLVNAGGDTIKTYVSIEGSPGQDVQTTLDASVLRATAERMGDRKGAAVVIDPATNEVLALYSSPSFDPDAFERGDAAVLTAISEDQDSPLANRATTGLYSAGSTFKLFTGAAGLLSGQFTTGSQIFCGSIWDGVDPPRRNWEGTQGPLTIAGGLMRSCNPVFYEIGLTLYNNTDDFLSQTARLFGFGAPTGIEGLYDEAGLVPDSTWKRENRGEPWYPGDEVNLAIGQGDLLITPLQLANAYSAFITRNLRTPVILAGREATSRGTIGLTDAQWEHLQSGLELVTSASGTANAAFAYQGYFDFAGKSGTAEDAGAQQHVLFVAFSPARAPVAVAAVVLDDGESGSIEAGPIARDLVLAAME